MSCNVAADDGRLKRTKGIGDRTYQVITQALEGRVPEYLAGLRESGAQPLAEGGDAVSPPCAATCTATASGPTAARRSS